MTNCSAKNGNLPIFTLQTLNKRTYIVSSPELVSAVERNEKTISFMPFISAMSPRMFDLSSHGPTMEMINRNINKEDGDWGLIHETSRGMRAAMAAGPNLDDMNKVTLGIMNDYFDELAACGESEVEFYNWIRPRFTVASTQAIYGPGNPYGRERSLEKDFW